MNYICGDNRYEIIERYKKELISATNIEGSPDEMAVLDNILFRFWQMGWLKEQEAVEPEVDVIDEIDSIYKCPKCHISFFYRKQKYCDKCGQAVKWNA